MSRSEAPGAEPDGAASGTAASSLGRLGLAVAALGYGTAARIHRRAARWLLPARGRPSCRVLSVGGLTVGGAGKTPVAAALASALQRRGRRVVLASRGYRARSREPVTLVSDGVRVHAGVERAGDEALVLVAHAPGVPVLVGRDRRSVGHRAVSRFDAELLVLDDGFQHHRLARDLDLVCIDGVSGVGNGRVLPAGPLREPISALRHADWLCVVDGDGAAGGCELVTRFSASGRPVIRASRRPSHLFSLESRKSRPLATLSGARVGLVSGVARPASFRRTIEALGAEVVAERRFPDHHAYRRSDLETLDRGVAEWVTTEKDAYKILPAWLGGRSLSVLSIEIALEDPTAVIDALDAALFGPPERA